MRIKWLKKSPHWPYKLLLFPIISGLVVGLIVAASNWAYNSHKESEDLKEKRAKSIRTLWATLVAAKELNVRYDSADSNLMLDQIGRAEQAKHLERWKQFIDLNEKNIDRRIQALDQLVRINHKPTYDKVLLTLNGPAQYPFANDESFSGVYPVVDPRVPVSTRNQFVSPASANSVCDKTMKDYSALAVKAESKIVSEKRAFLKSNCVEEIKNSKNRDLLKLIERNLP